MKIIENRVFPEERALYAANDVTLKNCSFDGEEEDGESALKEARGVSLENCFFNLRYPLWHDRAVSMTGCEMTDKARAAIWYTEGITVADSNLRGVKVFRECSDVVITNTKIDSPECLWRCRGVSADGIELGGEYAFMSSRGVTLKNARITGKYPFQYAEDVTVDNSYFETKDAFWHAKRVLVRDSVINGEYLAWYSEDLTLERCRIIGTQPLCYCKGLRLIDCETESCDLSFEYSEVDAAVRGAIESVKNPLRGRIAADSIGEIIITPDSVYPCECEIVKRDQSK